MSAHAAMAIDDRDRSRAAADALIAETQGRSAEFPHLLANHLPMVIEIMARLGAPAERLQAYAQLYTATNKVPRLAAPLAPITEEDWRSHLGDRSRETDYRRFFAAEVARLGWREAIRRTVPALAPGIGASALHGLMRLAYGVMRADEAEIGIALGYWAATFLPLPQPEGIAADLDDPLAVLLLMRERPAFRSPEVESDLLWHWIRAIGQEEELPPLVGRLRIGPQTLERIAEASLALYASTMSFEALHALTGAHWLRRIVPFVDDPRPLIRNFWQVIMAVYPKTGMPLPVISATLDAWRGLDVPDDAAIAAAAVASDDEHDPSLVFSAFEEFARTGDPLYRVVAARRVGLLPSLDSGLSDPARDEANRSYQTDFQNRKAKRPRRS